MNGNITKIAEQELNRINIIVKKNQIETFYKEAFCIDGNATFIEPQYITENGECFFKSPYVITGLVKLTDSKRGTFYIATAKKI